jgi:uncharacterized BrkB/YihY/UPF0761 family membrane protein
LFRRTIADTFDDACPGLAAQLAFYFLLALFSSVAVCRLAAGVSAGGCGVRHHRGAHAPVSAE